MWDAQRRKEKGKTAAHANTVHVSVNLLSCPGELIARKGSVCKEIGFRQASKGYNVTSIDLKPILSEL